ncbi:MAG: AmmeMemoRadiSam system radical SAM enzyme [Parasporobacterium sp.]|nr:AmmeMemoRadiSam system radical SAM enzyme [Parasporobacterium sp.]
MKTEICNVCFRHCRIEEGAAGFCGVRKNIGGKICYAYYGHITSLALDPIEKKPLRRFHPGSRILSVGGCGCNLRCPFCQNHEISVPDGNKQFHIPMETVSPEELVSLAMRCKAEGNIGIAFTYNEPLTGYEFVRDTARLAHEMGMLTVLVSNGTADLSILQEIIPYIDAMNIDLKGFTDDYYARVLHGNRAMVMEFIKEAVKHCHVELTTLIVPGENDSREEILDLSSWTAALSDVWEGRSGTEIPLHISRFFPRYHMKDRQPTSVRTIYSLAEAARQNLKYVYTGNC